MIRNELFHWLLVNLMCLASEKKILDYQLNLIETDLLLNLLKDESLVVSSEYGLYAFLKKFMVRDLSNQNQLQLILYQNQSDSEGFLASKTGAKYKPLFDHIRLNNLLSYPKKHNRLYHDRIFSSDELNKLLFKMYSDMMSMNEATSLNMFRFAKRIVNDGDFEFRNDFFCSGVDLLFKFNSKCLTVVRLPNVTSLMNYNHTTARIRFTLYASSINGRYKSEQTPTCVMDLQPGRERTIHNWRKVIKMRDVSCILFGEVQIMCGSQVIEIS